jgi:hypothetical protein
MSSESLPAPALTGAREPAWSSAVTTSGWLDRHRRALQLGLGVIWLLDAALQYQPYMFGKGFAQQIIAPVGPGNPAWIARPVHWAAHLTLDHRILADALFATIQLVIALGLFSHKTIKLALAGSIVWALLIWWMGEGLGGLFAGPQTPITGAPGAAVIYALISILVWPRDKDSADQSSESVATNSPLGTTIARVAWLVLWGSFAFECLQGVNRSPSGLHDTIAGGEDGEPAWLRAIDRGFASLLAHHGTEASIALAIVFAFIALAVFGTSRISRAAIVTAVILAIVIWFAGEDIGEIPTGQATDPNTGPLLVLLAAAYWPFRTALTSRPADHADGTPLERINDRLRALDNRVFGGKG